MDKGSMSEPIEIVARIEDFLNNGIGVPRVGDLVDLIASWRERGEALQPFADFCEEAEQFVADRAKDGGSPIMALGNRFRLSDFRRARAALGTQIGTAPTVHRNENASNS